MSDQTQPDQTSSTANEGSVDVSARLASLTAPRPGVASIWQRREAAPSAPLPVVQRAEEEDRALEPADPAPASAPVPPAPATNAIGRLTKVSAAELWSDADAMSTWIASNAEALSELTGLEGLRLGAPSGGTVLGTTPDGAAVCVVCEVGPSSDEGLGALLRAAAVQDGGTVVWLNGGPTDSHVAALSWLNRATPPRFFLSRATGVRIDGSASAPMFEVLVRPPRTAGAVEGATSAPQRRVDDHLPED